MIYLGSPGGDRAKHTKALWPSLGKAQNAETLCLAALHVGATTVGRIPQGSQ